MSGGFPPIKLCKDDTVYNQNKKHSFISKNNISIFDLANNKIKKPLFNIIDDDIEIINNI
jgi:hypothetical protein